MIDYDAHGRLHVESLDLAAIAARYGTPCYVYSKRALAAAYAAFRDACAGRDALVCYAMKANSNLAILNLFARLGAGFDIVSGGELARVIAAGGDPRKVVFSGVGKTEREIRAALAADILCFNVESESELARIERIAAELGKRAPISIRVNPDVDAGTHPYISTGLRENKFGVPLEAAMPMVRRATASRHLAMTGLDVHIGSQITEIAPFVDALERTLEIVDTVEAIGTPLAHIDLGGGLGIRYKDETPPAFAAYLGALFAVLGERSLKVILEPGRALVGNAGILLTRVEYLKPGPHKSFCVVDAAMNDLLRPALYDSWHEIRPVIRRDSGATIYDVVGPVCETGDFLGHARQLAVKEGDLLAVMSAGAYGMSMSSNYNARPRPAEVLVDGSGASVIRERESIESLYANEHIPPG